MPHRFEYKYLISTVHLEELRNNIHPYVELDPNLKNSVKNDYTVHSIYFDNSSLTSYFDKIEGLPFRKKFRIRSYNNKGRDSLLFLEIKKKHIDKIDKIRAPFSDLKLQELLESSDFPDSFTSGSIEGSGFESIRKFIFYIRQNILKPVVLVTYEREAFQGRFDKSLRITFDKKIRSLLFPSIKNLYTDNNLKECLKGCFILEIKFPKNVPPWLKSLIRKYDLKRRALSKYTMCIDSHCHGLFPGLDRQNRINVLLGSGIIRNDSQSVTLIKGLQNVQ